MNRITRILLAAAVVAAAALTTSACGSKSPSAANLPAKAEWATLTGRLVYREKMLLPPGTTGVVVLTDRAHYGDDQAWLGEARLGDLVAPPMAFAVRYDASRLQPGAEYGLRATLYDPDGQPMFATPELFLVDLAEGPPLGGVEVLLRRAGNTSPKP